MLYSFRNYSMAINEAIAEVQPATTQLLLQVMWMSLSVADEDNVSGGAF